MIQNAGTQQNITPKKVCLVVQRYGSEVVGGAEKLAKDMAEAMHQRLGWEVDVFTTTALDYISWKPVFPDGVHEVNGIKVHRYSVLFSRILKIFNVYHHAVCKLLQMRDRFPRYRKLFSLLLYLAEPLWYLLQGPTSPKMKSALKEFVATQKVDFLFLVTYLYNPTLYGAAIKGVPKLLVSNFHDEPASRFFTTRRLLEKSDRILANTEKERELIQQIVPQCKTPIDVVGVGIDEINRSQIADSEWEAAKNHGDYVLYLGRIDEQKGCVRLMDLFAEFSKSYSGKPLKLLLAGAKEPAIQILNHPDIVYLGFITEQHKKALILNAKCIVNLSRYESFSFLVLEALMVEVPCIINSACAVLHEYTKHAPICTGLSNDRDFTVLLEQAILWGALNNSDHEVIQKKFVTSRDWVRKHYSWDSVMGRLVESCEHLRKLN